MIALHHKESILCKVRAEQQKAARPHGWCIQEGQRDVHGAPQGI